MEHLEALSLQASQSGGYLLLPCDSMAVVMLSFSTCHCAGSRFAESQWRNSRRMGRRGRCDALKLAYESMPVMLLSAASSPDQCLCRLGCTRGSAAAPTCKCKSSSFSRAEQPC